MAINVQNEHPRDVLSNKGRSSAHEERGAIINTASINADKPNPTLLAYATTKGAIPEFHGKPSAAARRKGHSRQCGSARTHMDSAHPVDDAGRTVAEFGKKVLMKRPGQPAELATAYVMLADLLPSYISGATIAVTGGTPII
jgi:NAD(P)-dependent dehydrogenase (short-subunit alcohol dehydrogenase family)